MRKFLPYILIIVVIVNLFAPLGVALKNNEVLLSKNEARAAGIRILEDRGGIEVGSTAISLVVTAEFPTNFSGYDNERIVAVLVGGGKEYTQEISGDKYFPKVNDRTKSATIIFEDLQPETDYELYYYVGQLTTDTWAKFTGAITRFFTDNISTDSIVRNPANPDTFKLRTTAVGARSTLTKTESRANAEGILPPCDITSKTGFLGCMAQLFYYAVFVPTSFLFGLAGKFFDWTFAYSISDDSYRTAFVTEGWGIVRDICNMFFIFVLIYAAFGMIVGSHSIKSKSIVVSVIVIGLLINFSLFASQVLIDTSNILARLFYTSQAVEVIANDSSGNYSRGGVSTVQDAGLGELALSAALVNKINPQNIILGATKINVRDDVTGDSSQGVNTGKENGIGVGGFFLITLMASIVNVVGLFVFLSVGLIFVARVIGLWIAMVLAPFAFFSYTVPALSRAKMVGWKNWWSDLLGLCFVAPIFMFFMYLILLFLDGAFGGLIKEQDGPNWVLTVIIPFVFIMIFLMTAKKLAKEYAGNMGQMVIGAVNTVAGVATGAAVGVAAFAGRASIGRLTNKLGSSNSLNNLASGKDAAGNEIKNKNVFTALRQKAAIVAKKGATAGSKGSFDLRQTGAGNLFSAQTGLNLNKYTNFAGLDTKKGLGGYAGEQARKIEKEEKFAKTLGYDHHAYEHAQDEIAAREDEINTAKREKTKLEGERNLVRDSAPGEKASKAEKDAYQANLKVVNDRLAKKNNEIYDLENGDGKDGRPRGLNKMKKEAERIKEGREKEYYQYKRKQTGKLIKEQEKRDYYGNISKYATYEEGKRSGKQILKEFALGLAEGGLATGAAGLAVSAFTGLPLVAVGAGALTGGLFKGVRDTIKYSGTTNIKIGGGHNHVEKTTDTYKEPSGGEHGGGHTEHTTEHHDDHAGGDDHGHGGGGHH